jgi:hypothetical protein
MSRGIELTQGFFTTVDDEDFERLLQYKWHYHLGYARTNVTISPGKQKTLLMHSLIMGVVEGLEIDHINGDGINNRKSNLRSVTHAQNTRNLGMRKKETSSMYKGVSWHTRMNKWMSYIRFNGEKRYLGYYEIEESAALAYNEAATLLFGEFARPNVLRIGGD